MGKSLIDFKICHESIKILQLSPDGKVNSGGIYRDAKCRGIYLALFTDPDRDSCFSNYQIGWIKNEKKVPFCKLKMSLNRKSFFTIYKHSGDFFKCIFTILLQIQHENNFLPIPVDTDKAKCLGICLYDFFIYRSNFVFQSLEKRRHLGSGHKTVNSQ